MSTQHIDILLIGNHVWPRPPRADHVDYPVASGLAHRLGGTVDVIATSPSGRPRRAFTEWGSVLYAAGILGAPGFVMQAVILGARVLLQSRSKRVIASSDVLGGLVGSILSALFRLPLIVQIQGHTVNPGQEYGNSLKRRFISRAVRLALKRAELIRCLNHSIQQEVLAVHPTAHTVVLGSRVDTASFAPKNDDKQPSTERSAALITVGAMEPRKNHALLLRVLKGVADNGVEACLSLVGEGTQLEALQQLAASLGLSKRVDFLGRVSQRELVDLLRSHDAFVFPSLSEGQPRAVLEAMATGLPVIAARIPGIEDVIDHDASGLLVSANDVNAWTSAVCRVVTDRDLSSRLGSNGRARMVEKHGFDSSLDRMADLFRSVKPTP